MRYCCGTCGKTFNSEAKCLECENNHRVEMAKQECLKKEQVSRWEEVEEAYKKAQELREKYIEDYKTSSFSTVCPATFDGFLNKMHDAFFK